MGKEGEEECVFRMRFFCEARAGDREQRTWMCACCREELLAGEESGPTNHALPSRAFALPERPFGPFQQRSENCVYIQYYIVWGKVLNARKVISTSSVRK